MEKTNISNYKPKLVLAPVAIAADGVVTSLVIDTLGFDSVTLELIAGVVTTGDFSLTSIAESLVVGMTASTAIPATHYGSLISVDTTNDLVRTWFLPSKRFVQITFTGANTSVLLVTANVLLGDAYIQSTE